MQRFNDILADVNGVIWHNYVLYAVLAVGVLFTIWSVFTQYRALTHGVAVTLGRYDDKNDPGAINHFQALSAALSATVGLGNIGGVAVAIALGGPGAVFWMWIIGLAGMALKTTEVTLSMLYRNTDDPDNPHGGPMFVVHKGFKRMGLGPLGAVIGGVFVVTLLISAITGGNMFQAWNVCEVTFDAFGTPRPATGILMAVIVGVVIIGGIKRIGAVAGRLVPFMCALYLLSALYVIIMEIDAVPETFALIFRRAFSPADAGGAFVGASAGFAFAWGLKRALFSSEAGQGSSPIAHSAAKTDEPVREGVVAGLEPFIDTIVVCTLTALVLIVSGAYNRPYEAPFPSTPQVVQVGPGADGTTLWTLGEQRPDARPGYISVTELPAKEKRWLDVSGQWADNQDVFVVLRVSEPARDTNDNLRRLAGRTRALEDGSFVVDWATIPSATPPTFDEEQLGVYRDYVAAGLTTHAFNMVTPGLGTWLVLIASWLFAISTMISWSYYGEQGVVYMFGDKAVLPYKLIYCLAIIVACLGFIRTETELDNLTSLGTGVMLWANIPIMLIFGAQAMRAYHDYFRRMKSGEAEGPHKAPPFTDVVEGRDVK